MSIVCKYIATEGAAMRGKLGLFNQVLLYWEEMFISGKVPQVTSPLHLPIEERWGELIVPRADHLDRAANGRKATPENLP